MSHPKRALVFAACLLGSSSPLGCGGNAQAPARAPAASGVASENEAPRAVAAGDHPPAISVRSIDGVPLTLATGKVTLLVFWATWSEPDKKELIKLQEMYARFGPGKLSILALSIDDESDHLAEFAKTYGLRFPIAWDAGHRFASTYRVATDPTTYVIDRSGVIRFVHSGYHDDEAEEIASEIDSLSRGSDH